MSVPQLRVTAVVASAGAGDSGTRSHQPDQRIEQLKNCYGLERFPPWQRPKGRCAAEADGEPGSFSGLPDSRASPASYCDLLALRLRVQAEQLSNVLRPGRALRHPAPLEFDDEELEVA